MSSDAGQGRPPVLPGEFIRIELTKRGWSQEDLAHVLGRSPARVNQIITGKQELSPEIAIQLQYAIGTAADVWLQREAAYRLSLTAADVADVKLRSRLYDFGPIKEMQKRGWLKPDAAPDELEAEILRFYGIKSLDETPQVAGVMRKTAPLASLSHAQRAWYFRVRNLATKMPALPFDSAKMKECRADLRKLAAYSAHVAKVPKVLAHYGVRFVIVQPLEGGKVDGVATWLAANEPVIGLSMRFERIDNFWHTLLHEAVHVEHHDESVDMDMDDEPITAKPAYEKRAVDDAASTFVPRQELMAFIRRYGPLYSEQVINQLANKLKVHPGIIVGQLHHLGEVSYSKFRDLLVKVRDVIAPKSLTDGWGYTVDARFA
ncbi:MAG: transcriptional regulator [Gemmataceae bacterium]